MQTAGFHITRLISIVLVHLYVFRCIFRINGSPVDLDERTKDRLVRRDLGINVFNNGQWGHYSHLPMGKREYITKSRLCDMLQFFHGCKNYNFQISETL